MANFYEIFLNRFVIWHVIVLIYTLSFPIIRNILNRRNIFFGGILYNFFIATFLLGALNWLFLTNSSVQDYLKFPEFQFILLLCLGIYVFFTYPKVLAHWRSKAIDGKKINQSILKKIKNAFQGTSIEKETSSQNVSFSIKSLYRITYKVEVELSNEKIIFGIVSNISRIYMLLNLFLIYFSSSVLQSLISAIGAASEEDKSFVTTNGGDSQLTLPIIGFQVDVILAILLFGLLSIALLILEFQSGSSFSIELPHLYRKLLQEKTLAAIKDGPDDSRITSQKDYKSELETARERARNIISSRDTDVLNRKREEIHNKVQGMFQKDLPPLEDVTLERYVLMKSVERVLQSTPPWAKVSLADITKKIGGNEEEIELVIAGLRKSGEINGIYDIWTKIYSGSSHKDWYVTEILGKLTDKNSSASVESVKIHPDGSTEVNIVKK